MKITSTTQIKTSNISNKISNYIQDSKRAQNVFKFFDKNPSLANAMVVFGLATVIRPSTIMFSSGKDKDKRDDAIYSAARSITTGFVDLISALIIFLPLNKAIDKSTRILFNDKSTVFSQHKEACSAWKSVFNRMAKIALLPIISYFNFKYVRVVVDKMRKLKKSENKKDDNKQISKK